MKRIAARALKGRKSLKPSGSISRLWVARLRVLRMSAAQIAEELETTREVIAAILLEPEVSEAIDAAERGAFNDAQQALKAGALEAVLTLASAMRSKDQRIALDAAKTWLTKAGADAPSKSEAKNEHTGKDGAPLVPTFVPTTMAERRARNEAERLAIEETERDLKELLAAAAVDAAQADDQLHEEGEIE